MKADWSVFVVVVVWLLNENLKHQIFNKHREHYMVWYKLLLGNKKWWLCKDSSITLPYKTGEKHSEYSTLQSITPCIYSICNIADIHNIMHISIFYHHLSVYFLLFLHSISSLNESQNINKDAKHDSRKLYMVHVINFLLIYLFFFSFSIPSALVYLYIIFIFFMFFYVFLLVCHNFYFFAIHTYV